jgi:acetoin utilization deacetylase AcuC-like enzyme
MFISSHQQPLYPGTGYSDETGCGNVLNLPLAPGDGSTAFREAWRSEALPAVSRFDPDLVLVSAGFDAHTADPLAQLELGEADFRWITERVCNLADDCCAGRVVSVLEGGYDLEALAASCLEHVSALGC